MVKVFSKEEMDEIREDFEDLVDTEGAAFWAGESFSMIVKDIRGLPLSELENQLKEWEVGSSVSLKDTEGFVMPFIWGSREPESEPAWLIPLEAYIQQQGINYRFPQGRDLDLSWVFREDS